MRVAESVRARERQGMKDHYVGYRDEHPRRSQNGAGSSTIEGESDAAQETARIEPSCAMVGLSNRARGHRQSGALSLMKLANDHLPRMYAVIVRRKSSMKAAPLASRFSLVM